MSWQDDARRTIVSDKKELSTFDGYWVKVKKYSINAKDEINAATREVQKGMDKKALIEVAKKAREMGLAGEVVSENDIMDMLTPEQMSALLDSTSVASSKVMEAKLKNGIAEHSFGASTVDQLAHDILDYPDIANEILNYIEEFNRPLAKKTSPVSAMSPSGSTTEPPLSTEIPSQTEETPQKP